MKKITAVIAVIVALMLAGSSAWTFPNFWTTDSGTPESITIGILPLETSALVYIAEDQRFFAGNGLNATLRIYDAGLTAIDGMEKGEVDVSQSSEYPIVGEAFKKENISMIGCIDKFQSAYLAGRKDRGIENISDLKGKKIGVPRGTTTEFYLGRFLNLHGINLQDITIVDMKWEQSLDAFANGSADAIMLRRQLDINPVKERFGGNVVIWPAQSGQSAYFVMACRNDWIANHPETIARFLKSLDQAEQYSINHPNEAKAIVQRKMNFSDAYIAMIWPDHKFSLSLDQSLLIAMNDEGYWMINNNLTSEKTLPDFRDYIYTKGLEEVKPEAVNIR